MNYLLRTSEIILKGKNRRVFERILIENIKKKIGNDLILLKNYGGVYLLQTKNDVSEKIKKIFGIVNFSQVEIFENLEDLLKNLKLEKAQSFDVKVSRGDKDYPLNSLEIAEKVRKFIKEKFQTRIDKDSKTDLHRSQKTIYIYYKDKKFFLYDEKVKCFGGLPVGSSGKGLNLISAGFDSPTASFLAMKRGLKVYFLHFHSYPQTSKEVLEAVKNLVKILNQYNLGSELYF